MPADLQTQLQASVTKTGTFDGAAFTLPGGTPRRGLKAHILYSATNTSSGAGTTAWGIGVSYDAGSTWSVLFTAPTLVTSATAQSGEIFIPFDISPTSVANGTQIRLSVTALTGTGGTTTYQGDLELARP